MASPDNRDALLENFYEVGQRERNDEIHECGKRVHLDKLQRVTRILPSRSETISRAVAEGQVRIVGAVYRLSSGDLEILDLNETDRPLTRPGQSSG